MACPSEPTAAGESDPRRPGFVTRLPPPDAEANRLTAAVRRVHDSVVGVEAPSEVLAQASAHLEQAAALLEPHAMRVDSPPGWADLGRTVGNGLLGPPVRDVQADRDTFRATVTFSSFYLGANGAVHGGALPLLFDHVLGLLASTGRSLCRTAYLKVDFRRVTPIGRPLRIEARVEREEGRKRFLVGALYDGDEVTAEADGLWVALREGAP